MILFEHQLEMVSAASSNAKGIIQAPTGSGKTFAQAGIIVDEFSKGGFKLIMVKTPRIGLTNQVAKEHIDYINFQGYKANSLLIHSGASIEIEPDCNLTLEDQLKAADLVNEYSNATTSTTELLSQIKRSRELGIPFIVFTTYHSADKVINALDILDLIVDLDINDEAHYLVREDFSSILELTPPNRQYFFTATPLTSDSDSGRGMNNDDKFGGSIYEMGIAEAVSRHLILPVKPQIIKSGLDNVSQDDTDLAVGQFVKKSFDTLVGTFPNLGAKLLVSVRGSRQITTFLQSDEFLILRKGNVEVLTVHSTEEFTTYNGDVITRSEFDMLKLQLGNNPDSRLIIVHYDILAEGIDVPGLLGVLILRNMKEAKFLQTIGRAIRVYRKNPDFKKFGMLFFPEVNDKDLSANFINMLINITEKGYLPSQMINEFLTLGSEEDIDELDQFDTFNSIIKSEVDLRLYSQSLDIVFDEL